MNESHAYVLGRLDYIVALDRSDEDTGDRMLAFIRSPAKQTSVVSNNTSLDTNNSVTTTYRNTCFEAAAVKSSKGARSTEESPVVCYIVKFSCAFAADAETRIANKCGRTLNSVVDVSMSAISHVYERNGPLEDNYTEKDLEEDESDMLVVGIENRCVKDEDDTMFDNSGTGELISNNNAIDASIIIDIHADKSDKNTINNSPIEGAANKGNTTWQFEDTNNKEVGTVFMQNGDEKVHFHTDTPTSPP